MVRWGLVRYGGVMYDMVGPGKAQQAMSCCFGIIDLLNCCRVWYCQVWYGQVGCGEVWLGGVE